MPGNLKFAGAPFRKITALKGLFYTVARNSLREGNAEDLKIRNFQYKAYTEH